MQSTMIENTDVRVSRLSFGTASMHHVFSALQRQRMLEAAALAGIRHFDTAPYYGYGLAEADLGVFLQGRRGAFTVTTKVGLYPYGRASHNALEVWTRKATGKIYPKLSAPEVDWHVKRAANSLNGSLKRLKTDHVDFLFLHEPDINVINTDVFLRWLETERAAGKVRYWGLAGEPGRIKPWLTSRHPLATVLQTRDDLMMKSANFILENGRQLQFTYGYLSSINTDESAIEIMRNALLRNTQGSILVSTRHPERITELARCVK
ncbi:MAG: aldo/keto reductase [Methylococcaceae bacterium]